MTIMIKVGNTADYRLVNSRHSSLSHFLDGLLEVFFIGQVSGFLETGGMEAPSYGIKVFTLSTGKREEDDNCQ